MTLTAVDLSGQGSSSVDHSRLMVYLSSIDIENQGQCKYDWVEVDDGSSRTTADFSSTFNLYMSRLVRKPIMWFLNRSDTNQTAQSLKQARGLKCLI